MFVLCWDIDGTLLTTGRAGILAWEDAVRVVLGLRVDLSRMDTAGLTDIEIATRLAEEFGEGLAGRASSDLLRWYENYLPERLPMRKGRVLPGVREVLDHLGGHPHVTSMLLTGNTRVGAAAKLAHYGLDSYFSLGAFADGAPGDRISVARRAWSLAREVAGGDLRPEQVFVIGDTPHDIRCGKEIGARTVAVASGAYSVTELERYNPWWVMERITEPTAFAARLGLHGSSPGSRP